MSLKISHLTAGYPKRPVLQDVTVAELASDRIVALLGPNGAGKSTLLRAIAGLLRVQGDVSYRGQSLRALSMRERSRLLGFAPQALPPPSALGVLDATVAALRIARPELSHDEAASVGYSALERLGGGRLALEPFSSLSGGQRQIAGLAPLLAVDPPVLLLDEPMSALDMAHQFRLMRLLQGLARAGRLVIMVLHDIPFAARWADDIVVLQEGRLVAQGTPAQVLTADFLRDVWKVKATVGGDPPRIHIEDTAEERTGDESAL